MWVCPWSESMMTRWISFALCAASAAAQPKPLFPDAKPVRSCESLASLSLPDTTIDSAAVEPAANRPAICRVTASVTHPPAGDRIRVFLGFPVDNWNGRFEGVGGGGFSGGNPNGVLAPAA